MEILLLALLLDALIGDPPVFYRIVSHPVVLLGRCIAFAEQRLNHGAAVLRLLSGGLLTFCLSAGAALIGWAMSEFCDFLPGGWLLAGIFASTLIAWRGLFDHVRAVGKGLRLSPAAGRAAVSHIVGRDPASLDEAGVARAAIESCAENFSDGVVAPAFWMMILGLPGLCAYKTINTLDSMIGYRSRRYALFGKCAARLDDAANWLPARLAGFLFVAAAWLWPGADGRRAWRTMWRDARKHRSPNAGWQESALAGALDFALAGPRRYADYVAEDAWMGDGRCELNADDISAALCLYCIAGALLLLCVAVIALW